jgi:PAS domain S-box-containing protein
MNYIHPFLLGKLEDGLMAKKPTYEELELRVQELEKEAEKRKHSEKELMVSEQRYRRLAENAKDMIYRMCLPEGRYEYVSPASIDIFGYSAEEFYNSPFLIQKVIHPDWQDYFEEQWSNIKAGNMAPFYEYPIIHKSGQTRWLHQHNVLIRDNNEHPVAIEGIVTDITDRKQAEEKLRESEEKYRFLIENIPSVTWITNEAGETTFIGPNVEKIYGFSQKEICEKGEALWFGRIHPEDIVKVRESFKNMFTDEMRFDVEYRIKRKDGKWIWLHDLAIMAYEEDGVKYAYGVFSDITERKRAEEALRESERIFSLFMEYSPIYVFFKDENIRSIRLSRNYEQMLGRPIDELLDKTMDELFPSNLAKSMIDDDIRILNEGKPITVEEDFNGRFYETTKFPILINGKPKYLAGYTTDITERKLSEEALRESEEKLARSRKMESIGLLAGGVAHDLNNVLSGIVSIPELILMDLPEDSKLRKPIKIMHESGQRAVTIVQDLLTVARGVAITKEPLNLNDIVSDYLQSPEFNKLKHIHPTVMIKTDLDSHLLNIGGSPIHIRKVVMNLVSNASEAIKGSGNVVISTMNRYLDRPIRGYDDLEIGEYAILSVKDDGSGISSVDLERIFDPFYTKKVMGRSGTGLGLTVVWNVVQDHKGYIDVKTDEKGTTFELYFPITRDEALGQDVDVSIEDLKGKGETILVVDDEESQREISCHMLDILGYKAKAVSSGEEAVEYLKEHTADLILLDMIMDPGINGRETYERVIEIHPDQKAIIISGFAETDDVKEAQKLGAGKYLKKPVTLEKIGLAVKEELTKRIIDL